MDKIDLDIMWRAYWECCKVLGTAIVFLTTPLWVGPYFAYKKWWKK